MNKKDQIIYIGIIFILIILLIVSIYIIFSKTKGIKKENIYGELRSLPSEYFSDKEYFLYSDVSMKTYEEKPKDSNGIILFTYNGEDIYDIKSISYYGLMLFSKYVLSNDEQSYELAKKQADYLLSIQNNENGGFYNQYNYLVDGTTYEMKSPWISATSQSMAISLLSRVYSISKEEKYKNSCILALKPFEEKVENGGLSTKLFDYTFFEEYPTEIPNYSFAGLMFTIIGMYDEYQIIGTEEANNIYKKAMDTLEHVIPFYDYYDTSILNLAYIKNKNLQKTYQEAYTRQHIYQLNAINNINSKEIFKYYIDNWSEVYYKEAKKLKRN